jgi:hypothetical protein
MTEPDILKLINQIEELRSQSCSRLRKLEHFTRDKLIEEPAILRDLVMRIDGLKLMLGRHEAPK